MQSNKPRDTLPERALRSAMQRVGLRFRKHYRALPGMRYTIDAALLGPKVAVYLNGCFWHGCPAHGSLPKSHTAFWQDKLARTRYRDFEVDRLLTEAGWLVVRIWEHEAPFDLSAQRIAELVRTRRNLLGR